MVEGRWRRRMRQGRRKIPGLRFRSQRSRDQGSEDNLDAWEAPCQERAGVISKEEVLVTSFVPLSK